MYEFPKIYISSFPSTKGGKWENIFPTCTTKNEIGLVDGLVKYNPEKRYKAAEVSRNILFIKN